MSPLGHRYCVQWRELHTDYLYADSLEDAKRRAEQAMLDVSSEFDPDGSRCDAEVLNVKEVPAWSPLPTETKN